MPVSKITNIQGSGTWDYQGTTMYSFEYNFADGTNLKANHKSAQSPFQVGQEALYEITKEDPQYGKSGKVKKPESANFQGGQKNYGSKGNNRSFALSYAKDMVVALLGSGVKVSTDETLGIADKFLAWLDQKPVEQNHNPKPQVQPQQQNQLPPQQPQEAFFTDEDGLPF